MDISVLEVLAIVAIIFLAWIVKCLNILREYERGVVFRLGRVLSKPKGPVSS